MRCSARRYELTRAAAITLAAPGGQGIAYRFQCPFTRPHND